MGSRVEPYATLYGTLYVIPRHQSAFNGCGTSAFLCDSDDGSGRTFSIQISPEQSARHCESPKDFASIVHNPLFDFFLLWSRYFDVPSR